MANHHNHFHTAAAFHHPAPTARLFPLLRRKSNSSCPTAFCPPKRFLKLTAFTSQPSTFAATPMACRTSTSSPTFPEELLLLSAFLLAVLPVSPHAHHSGLYQDHHSFTKSRRRTSGGRHTHELSSCSMPTTRSWTDGSTSCAFTPCQV